MEISENEYMGLKAKADKWDQLDEELSMCYDEDSESDLCDIGEKAAIAFGYL